MPPPWNYISRAQKLNGIGSCVRSCWRKVRLGRSLAATFATRPWPAYLRGSHLGAATTPTKSLGPANVHHLLQGRLVPSAAPCEPETTLKRRPAEALALSKPFACPSLKRVRFVTGQNEKSCPCKAKTTKIGSPNTCASFERTYSKSFRRAITTWKIVPTRGF